MTTMLAHHLLNQQVMGMGCMDMFADFPSTSMGVREACQGCAALLCHRDLAGQGGTAFNALLTRGRKPSQSSLVGDQRCKHCYLYGEHTEL